MHATRTPDEGYANPTALVSADWLQERLDDPDVRIVEIDVSPKSYEAGHLPGAVYWDIYKTLKDPSYRLIDAAAFERVLGDAGITDRTTVVLYGYGPVFGYWLLKLYRHPNARVLNLAKQRWIDEERPLATEAPAVASTSYPLPPQDDDLRAEHPEVSGGLGSGHRALLDTRSGAEFRGERFWPSGTPESRGRAGRIPGALHVPLDDALQADGSFAPVDELRRLFPAQIAGVPELITYCTIGNRASVGWFVLTELLGRRGVSVYDGSWAEWGFMDDAPVAVGSEAIGALPR
jgi:thiosulfate/3-mercaptopyruvate sulfurtransferase